MNLSIASPPRTTKGQFDVASKTIYWMIVGFTVSMLIIAFAFLISGYKEKLTGIPGELKADFISLRFVNNPDCFAYQDPNTNQLYLGSIDLTKFTQDRLDDCYKTPQELGYHNINFRLKLQTTTAPELITNNYYNVDHFTLRKNVMVWDGKTFTKDELLIYVQEAIPRRPADETLRDKEVVRNIN